MKVVPRNKAHYILVKQLPAINGFSSAWLHVSSCKQKSGIGLLQRKLTKGNTINPVGQNDSENRMWIWVRKCTK